MDILLVAFGVIVGLAAGFAGAIWLIKQAVANAIGRGLGW
jgi:hypothetical protein